MSITPSGLFIPSMPCSRSASHAPPVYRPTIAVLGPMRGLSSAASCSHSFSASGSFVKVLLQDQLGCHGIDGLLLHAAQTVLSFHRGVALVDARHRQLEAALESPREILRLAGHLVRLALRGCRQ